MYQGMTVNFANLSRQIWKPPPPPAFIKQESSASPTVLHQHTLASRVSQGTTAFAPFSVTLPDSSFFLLLHKPSGCHPPCTVATPSLAL